MSTQPYYSELFGKVFSMVIERPEIEAIYSRERSLSEEYYYKRYNSAQTNSEAPRYNSTPYALTVVIYTFEVRRAIYNVSYTYIKEHIKKEEAPIPWDALFKELKTVGFWMSDVFVRIAEEEGGRAFTTPEQLQQATGITEPLESLGNCLNEAKLNRYISAMEDKLRAGGCYEDVEQVDPAQYNLIGRAWQTNYGEYTKEKAIGFAIALAFDMMVKEGSIGIREVASRINAPYNVVLEAASMRDELISDVRQAK